MCRGLNVVEKGDHRGTVSSSVDVSELLVGAESAQLESEETGRD